MSTRLLTSLIDRKHAMLTQLRELSRVQVRLVGAGDWATLMRVLSAKGRLIEAVRDLERQLDPFRDQTPDSRSWPDERDRSHCRDVADQCVRLLADVVRLEKESETELVRRRDLAAEELDGIRASAAVRGAYAANSESTSIELNLVSER
jgi:hypothetical protein